MARRLGDNLIGAGIGIGIEGIEVGSSSREGKGGREIDGGRGGIGSGWWWGLLRKTGYVGGCEKL